MKNKILKPFLILTVALTITSCGSKDKVDEKQETQIEQQKAEKNKPAKNIKEGINEDMEIQIDAEENTEEELENLITDLEDSQKDMEDLRGELETNADKNSKDN